MVWVPESLTLRSWCYSVLML